MAASENGLCMGCMSPLMEGTRCGVCGYDPTEPKNPAYLPPATALGERYLVGKLCATDPEGAWYVGYDKREARRVWVREYMPAVIARRERGAVCPNAGSEAQYKALMSDFEDLCRAIGRLPPTEHVLPIVDMVRLNNTIYAIYRYVKTMTLAAFLERSGGKLSWRHTKKLLMPLYHTVANIHKAGLIHRGISPDTVQLDQTGALWLGSFTIAAARTNKSELSAQLFDGYSAPEQYALNSWQGTWTDVYALGAITYRTVTGETPPPALDRVYGDDLLDSQLTSAEMTESAVNAINKALAFEVEDRIQTAEAMIAELLATDGSNTAVYTAPRRAYESPDDSRRREEIRASASARALQDAEPPRTSARYENLDGGVDLLPPPKKRGNAVARANARTERSSRVAAEERGTRRKKKKGAHPVLSLIFSAFVATALLGGAVYYVATHFLSDLLVPAGPSQSESSDEKSADGGADYSGDATQEDGKVPRFVGITVDSIKENRKLAERFEMVYREGFNKDYEAGVVYDQQPIEGTEIAEGGKITLSVSKGIEMVEMPEVVDLPIEDAAKLLEGLNIKFDIIPLYDNTLEAGVIVRCNTAAGVKVEAGGSAVMLFIKNEPVETSSDEEESSSSGGKKPSKSSSKSSSKKEATVSFDENGNKVYFFENNDE